MAKDVLGILERSYEEQISHWKHGGLVGVMGYGGGVIGRYCDLPEEFPNVSGVPHLSASTSRRAGSTPRTPCAQLCDIWEKHGSGLTNMHGSTGDIIFLGGTTESLEPFFAELSRQRLRPRRLRLQHADAELLRRPGPLRVGLLRHPGRLLRHHPALPGRAAPAGLPLQVQVQVRRLPERLRGLDRPLRLLGHRHLEGRHPGRPEAKVSEYAKQRHRHPGRGLRPLPDQLHELGRQDARDRQLQLRQVHALHQRDAQGAQARQGARRHHPDRLQGPDHRRRAAVARSSCRSSRWSRRTTTSRS